MRTNHSNFSISGYCASAGEVGGDVCEVLPVGRNVMLLVMADVMGKGTPAAGFARKLRELAETLAGLTPQPAELLSAINQLMYRELSESGVFITAQLALADFGAGRLTVASAGHCPLLLAHANGAGHALSPEGMPLGIVPRQAFAAETFPLDGSCCALLYTDGLTEARNAQGEFLGQDYLHGWLREMAPQEQSATALAHELISKLRRFQHTVAPQDDQAFLLLCAAPNTAVEHVDGQALGRASLPASHGIAVELKAGSAGASPYRPTPHITTTE
jgi:serine phosphatase RsbU (regulator of sigma subunit)